MIVDEDDQNPHNGVAKRNENNNEINNNMMQMSAKSIEAEENVNFDTKPQNECCLNDEKPKIVPFVKELSSNNSPDDKNSATKNIEYGKKNSC